MQGACAAVLHESLTVLKRSRARELAERSGVGEDSAKMCVHRSEMWRAYE
jgi:hypothetical protein